MANECATGCEARFPAFDMGRECLVLEGFVHLGPTPESSHDRPMDGRLAANDGCIDAMEYPTRLELRLRLS